MDDPGRIGIERLKHILEAISKIEKFYKDVDEQKFLEDEQVSGSVLYRFSSFKIMEIVDTDRWSGA